MGSAAPPLRRGFVLQRSTPFSYECRACSRCCRNKLIRINPYEVARLAEVLGTTTTEVLARSTTEGGSVLATKPDGSCVFLGERGCTVHPGRPTACRLYPLGRSRDADETERFAELEPVEGSEGVYGETGTVDDFLRSQDVARHIAAGGRYVEILKRMIAALAIRPNTQDLHDEATGVVSRAPLPGDENLLDMDAVVRKWCDQHGAAFPTDVEAKTDLHLRALEEYIEGLES